MKEKQPIAGPSRKERDRRWRKVRQWMGAKKLDCLLVWGDSSKRDTRSANLRYLTRLGGNGHEGLAIFPLLGEPTFIQYGSGIFLPWLKRVNDWVDDIRPTGSALDSPDIRTLEETALERVRGLGLEEGRMGLVSFGQMPNDLYFRLSSLLPNAEITDATAIVEEARMTKSDEEVSLLKRAAAIGDDVLDEVVKAVPKGPTEQELFAKMMHTMYDAGAEYSAMVLLTSGPKPLPHPGLMPTTRTIRSGDIVNVEFHVNFGGYLSHHERSIAVGAVDRGLKNMARLSAETYRGALKKVRDGVDSAILLEALGGPVEEAGLNLTELNLHGHGLDSGEAPSRGFLSDPYHRQPRERGRWRRLRPLKVGAGMVFAFLLDVATEDWKSGVMLAETCAVTKAGADLLGRTEIGLLEA